MKRIASLLKVLVVLALTGGLPLFAGSAAAQQMRLNHTFGVNGFLDLAVKEFAKNVEAKSGGKLTFRVFSAGELGQELQQYDLLQVGALESALMGSQVLAAVAPEYNAFEMPYLWRDQSHLRKVWDGPIGAEVSQAILSRKGIRIIAAMNRGARNLTTSNKPVKTPADLAGLKIRTTQNAVHVSAWRALGAIPSPMAIGEVYLALKQGVIDGQENPVDLIAASSFQEVQKFLMMTEHVRSVAWFGVSEVWFGKLPEDLKKLVLAEAAAAAEWNDRKLAEEEKKLLATLEGKMTIVPASEIDLPAFRARMKAVSDEFASVWKRGLLEAITNAK
jgi:tripartite ATP-independent transporter DctP family solute receptor